MSAGKGTVEYGARQVAHNCLRISGGEKVVLITDIATREVADAIERAATDVGAEVQLFVMEDFGERPEHPSDETPALAFPDEIADAMKGVQVSIYAAGSKDGEFPTFRKPMFGPVTECRLRHGHMPTISADIMKSAMCADYSLVQRLSARVWGLVYKITEAHLTTPAGTDLTISLSPHLKWLVDDGLILPGKLGNLPAGEVFGSPLSVNGKFVVDGYVGDCYDKIPSSPISMDVKDGRVILDSITSDDAEFANALRGHFARDENANRFGEIGIGTNPEAQMAFSLLEAEKCLTVHMAVGHPFPEETGADWDSDIHVDMLVQRPTLRLETGVFIFKNGELNPNIMEGLV